MNTILCIYLQDLRLLRRDPTPFAVLFVIPALALLLFTPALGATLREQGYPAASGIELALPGMAVMFDSLGAAFLGFAIFREHQWQSWERILASGVPLKWLLIGKILLPITLVFSQQLLLLALVIIFYNTPVPDSLLVYLINALAFSINIAALGLAIAAFARSLQQMNAVVHVISIVFAASSGAFIAISDMPTMLASFTQITPSYWFVKTQIRVLLEPQTLFHYLPAIGVLLVQSLLFLMIGLWRFRGEERKYNWA